MTALILAEPQTPSPVLASAVLAGEGTHTIAVPTPEPLVVDSASTPLLLSLNAIDVQPGFNPRKFFNPERYRRLVTSVRRHRRIFQNIVVRPQPHSPDRYWIVAGERRWRAAAECELPLIPALVLNLTDDEALALAIAENNDRDDISPGEEALSAQRMMHLTQGDRAEAASRLNWSPEKLAARLLLSQATEAVLMALAEGKIKLGHAELLSTLPEATQDGTLQEVIARKPKVEELRAKLDAFALDLATAIFDTAGCQACPHNTTRQASLFEQHIGEGRCTNRPCFHGKTVAHLQEVRIGLRDEHNAVYLDVERVPNSWALLLKGEVGSQQFNEGCKSCAHFGCLLSSKPGGAGKITKDVCFDLTCRAGKIAAFQAQLAASETPESGDEAANSDSQGPGAPASGSPARKPTRKKVSTAAAPRRVQERIHDIQRRAATAEVAGDRKMTEVYAILAMLHELGGLNLDLRENDPLRLRGVSRSSGDTRTGLIAALYARDETVLAEIMADLAGRIAGRGANDTVMDGVQYLKGAQATLRTLDTDLAKHFCLDAPFLAVHTKSGIEALLSESGFSAYYNARKNDSGAVKKLMGGKHADIIKEVMKAGFDFKDFVPQALRVPTK